MPASAPTWDQLGTALDWTAIRATDFRDRAVQYGKQAEFLVNDCFPFACFRAVGVQNEDVAERVTALLAGLPDPPRVQVRLGLVLLTSHRMGARWSDSFAAT